MEKVTILKIMTYDGEIEIPFINLESLDLFTVRFENRDDLVDSMFDILNISIDKKRVRDVYVYYEYIKKGQVREKVARVKYHRDNVDNKSLPGFLKELLRSDHNLIHYCGVRKIRSKGIRDYISRERDILDYEIDYAVDKYFEGASYGVYRKIYFFLKDNGVKFIVNKRFSNNKNIDRSLSKFHSDNDYVQSLLRRANDELECDRVVDELSKIDLEELRELLVNPNFGLFDGVNNDRKYTLEDLYDLEKCTGMSLDELSFIANRIKKVYRR